MDDPFWQKEKAKEVVGTIVSDAFLLSCCEQGTDSAVSVPLFDGIPVHTNVHLGCYGDFYLPFFPVILLELPPPSHPGVPNGCHFPPPLISCLKGSDVPPESFVVAHSLPTLGPCQHFICENEDEMNLMFHPWVYRGCVFNELFSDIQVVQMGVFGANGILPVHQDLKSFHARGIPFDTLEEREVSVHNQCFSPANAQVQLCPEAQMAFFFSVGRTQTSREIITYHLVPLTPTVEALLLKIAAESRTLCDLCESLVRQQEALFLGERGVSYFLRFLQWVGVLSEQRVAQLVQGNQELN
mmetsp:Transcript_18122/g.28373  ORF Transcript_18122/g.28373 Transcript_18122/m.28373 type:complete len:298 (-) Transcript_18122:667-1560(-)